MIPYFEWRTFALGPLTLQVWGLFAAVGVLSGYAYARREAKRRGLDAVAFEHLAFSVLLWTFIGARLFHVLFYEPAYYLAQPVEIIAVWHGGLSSFGGFAGAALAFFRAMRKKTLPLLPTADVLVPASFLGLGCGRIGCFLIHDHPGTLAYGAGTWFAVRYPDGPRYDLGLLLGAVDFLLFGWFLLLMRKKRPPGSIFAAAMLIYGPVRFLLDFLRETDARYLGLTPAQYGSLALLACGLMLFRRIHVRTETRNVAAS